ncbi:MAG TPA: threonine ammonia-lyase [Alphaproteobacteria bacterium]|nr:threonine ammonia-lyase [Alphaproteobacteria bacterium]HAJ45482.1 threonine ammonia-lyase [Alphaproteobacteria bacterium]
MSVTYADVRAAQERIAGAVSHTPFLPSRTLSGLAGTDLYFKFENLQFTASFKERGALNKLSHLSAEERKRGVIAMSAGNHAQGVAYHAARLGVPATIVMPEGTPFVKVKHTMGHGARVILHGSTLAEAQSHAYALAASEGYVFVHPYDDDLVIAGQGTIAIEMLEAVPDLEVLCIPVGGGGLISGCAIAAKAIKPSIKVIGVETELFPAMHNMLKGGNAPIGGQTIAEGIAVRNIGERTKAICARLLDDIVLVPEEAIERAIALLLNIEKTVVEGAGATGLAAVFEHPKHFEGRKTGIVLCGGNIDPRLLSTVILRELQRDGKILNIGVVIDDRPGILAKIATLVGDAGGNIIEVSHNRMLTDMPAKLAELRLSIESRDAEHAKAICEAITGGGYQVRNYAAIAH